MKPIFIKLTIAYENYIQPLFLNVNLIESIQANERNGETPTTLVFTSSTRWVDGTYDAYRVLETPEEIFQKIKEATGEKNETV